MVLKLVGRHFPLQVNSIIWKTLLSVSLQKSSTYRHMYMVKFLQYLSNHPTGEVGKKLVFGSTVK